MKLHSAGFEYGKHVLACQGLNCYFGITNASREEKGILKIEEQIPYKWYIRLPIVYVLILFVHLAKAGYLSKP